MAIKIRSPAARPLNSHVSALVYTLCNNRRLPLLVTDLLAGYLNDRDLLVLSRVSQTLHDLTIAPIYNSISLDLSDPVEFGPRVVLLLRTLLSNYAATRQVCSLSIIGDPLAQWRDLLQETPENGRSIENSFRGWSPPPFTFDLSAFAPREIELYRELYRSLPEQFEARHCYIPLSRLCIDVIKLTTSLQELCISSDYFRCPDFRNGFRHLVEGQGLQSLRRSVLCLDIVSGHNRRINAVGDWDQALFTPFLITNIESIETAMTLFPEHVSHLRPCSLTRLVLYHCQIQDFDLNGLLAVTSNLTCLEYHASVDWAWMSSKRYKEARQKRGRGVDALFRALHHVKDTLEELVASEKVGEDCIHVQTGYEPPFQQHEELSKLRRLHTLSIPYTSLLGRSRQEEHEWDWHEMLPTSLCDITFTDEPVENFVGDCWTDESLLPVFSGLLSWFAACSTRTRPLKFRVKILQSSCEFKQAYQQSLIRMCEGHGILCSIEEPRPDRSKPQTFHGPP